MLSLSLLQEEHSTVAIYILLFFSTYENIYFYIFYRKESILFFFMLRIILCSSNLTVRKQTSKTRKDREHMRKYLEESGELVKVLTLKELCSLESRLQEYIEKLKEDESTAYSKAENKKNASDRFQLFEKANETRYLREDVEKERTLIFG